MTDLVLGDNVSAFQRLLLRLITLLTGAPFSNFKNIEDYRSDFVNERFESVKIEDISKEVLPGLQSFIHRHRQEMKDFGISGKWTGYLVFAKVLSWWWRSKVVRFIVVKASKGTE
jgi:hypothetical protein